MITGKKVSLAYKNQQVLKNVSFDLAPGRITTFMGQSGAGKTSLLRCLSHLNTHYEGTILCDCKDLKDLTPKERASAVGFVLQQFHLFPHMTVLQNCTYALTYTFGETVANANLIAEQLLTQLGMEKFLGSRPAHLSGGQQQRVAIARASALRPQVLLLDEPTSALDPESKKSLETSLLELNKTGITIAISSHDMPFIRNIIDVVYFMENGTIIEQWDRQLESEVPVKIQTFLKHT